MLQPRRGPTEMVAWLVVVLLAPNMLLAIDESPDWHLWSEVGASEEAIDSLTDQMALIGLSPLGRDPRVFQPDPDKPLSLKQLPLNIPPFGLNLSSGNTSDEQLMSLKAHPNLYSLSLDGFANGEACLSAIREQTSLRFLSVVDCGLTDDQLSQLTKLPHLETLDLRRTKINGPGLAALKSLSELKSLEIDMTADQFHALKTNQLVHLLPVAHGKNRTTAAKDEEITELELNGFYGYRVTDEMLRNLQYLTSLSKLSLIEAEITEEAIPELVRLQCLQELNLEGTRIQDGALRELSKASLLKSLVLDKTEVTPSGLQHLSKLESLTELHLNRCTLNDESLKVLGNLPWLERLEIGGTQIRFEQNLLPGTFPKLTSLNLNGSKVTDKGIAAISEFSELRWLDLTLCHVGDPGFASLRNCRRLEVLYLNLTGISDDALRHLGAIETLQVLSLNTTGITDAGVKHLSKSKNLKSLILLGTKVSPEAAQRLQSKLPNCEIVR
jgi:internalin A